MTINLEVLIVLSLLLSTLLIIYNQFIVKPSSFTTRKEQEDMEDTKTDKETTKEEVLQALAEVNRKAQGAQTPALRASTAVWDTINQHRDKALQAREIAEENSAGQECEAPAGEGGVVVAEDLSRTMGVLTCLSLVNSLVPEVTEDTEDSHSLTEPVSFKEPESLDSLLPSESSSPSSSYSDSSLEDFLYSDIPF